MRKKETLNNILKYHNSRDYPLAKKKYLGFIEKNKTNSDAYHLLGMLYYNFEGNTSKAKANITQAIYFNPKNYEAFLNRGVINFAEGKIYEAIDDFTSSLNLNKDYEIAYNNRGKALADLGEFDKSISDFDKAIKLNPNYPAAYIGRSNSRKHVHDFVGAINDLDIALSINSNFYEAIFSKSLLLLLLGDFNNGLKLFESRWKARKPNNIFINRNEKLWLGDDSLDGKALFIPYEQGLGDTIQFSRYLKKLENFNCKVLIEVQKPLIEFVSTISSSIKVFEAGHCDEKYDFYCPIMSLPLAFKTTIKSVPYQNRYLSSDHLKTCKWSNILGEKTKPRIGIAWSGSKNNDQDKYRSTRLKHFAKCLDEKYEWISLHKEYEDEDKEHLSFFNIRDFSNFQTDFTETAAQIENLDLVISVDTSIAHCAGAIGKKTIIIIPYTPDWRWQLGTKKTPWYSSVELCRLEKNQSWEEIFLKLMGRLDDLI